jgi:hypothetical protein
MPAKTTFWPYIQVGRSSGSLHPDLSLPRKTEKLAVAGSFQRRRVPKGEGLQQQLLAPVNPACSLCILRPGHSNPRFQRGARLSFGCSEGPPLCHQVLEPPSGSPLGFERSLEVLGKFAGLREISRAVGSQMEHGWRGRDAARLLPLTSCTRSRSRCPRSQTPNAGRSPAAPPGRQPRLTSSGKSSLLWSI